MTWLQNALLGALLPGLLLAGWAEARPEDPDLFGIYTAELSGQNVKRIVSNPTRQMTHARVSHDKKWITLTRYNEGGKGGLATEEDGYANTEIMIVRLDGTGLETVIPPRRGLIAANSSWTDDDKGLLFISTDNPKRIPQIMKVNLATRKITRVRTPEGLKVTDPHCVGNTIVYPVKESGGPDSVWIMNLDGSRTRQLTHPKFSESRKDQGINPGDYDPKLSPDSTRVAFMRLHGKEGWRVFVVEVKTGKETDLSGPNSIDGVPDWSSDGKLLVFWHADRKNLRQMGIYTMRSDGSERQMVPLPRGYLHGHPSFFPGDGSSKDARIIYGAKKFPGLP